MSFLRWFRRESTNDQCGSMNQMLPTSLCGINMWLSKLSQDEGYIYLQHNDTYNEIISNTSNWKMKELHSNANRKMPISLWFSIFAETKCFITQSSIYFNGNRNERFYKNLDDLDLRKRCVGLFFTLSRCTKIENIEAFYHLEERISSEGQ